MLYLDYDFLKFKYHETQRRYEDILSEKEMLFTKTQPKAVQITDEKVTGGQQGNSFDNYLIEKERKHIDERLLECKSMLDEREQLLQSKEQELRLSKDLHDKIYVLKHLEKVKPKEIGKIVGYSESQVYRILDTIDMRVKDARKCENICDKVSL